MWEYKYGNDYFVSKQTKRTMKIKLPIYWDFKSQEESEVIVNVPNAAAKKVLMAFLMRKDYDERREWLIKNVPEINLNIPKELL